jgi:hypothetical protein
MITQQSWMFLGSFSNLRTNILDKCYVVNMVHLGARAFDEISGEVVQTTAFVLRNEKLDNYDTRYFRVIDETGENDKKIFPT